MQYLPKNKHLFSAGKQSFEHNMTLLRAYRAWRITAILQQKSEWLVLEGSIPGASHSLYTLYVRGHGLLPFRGIVRLGPNTS